jgi:hypothetical protein
MAKADDKSSTMIWLRDALALAVRAFGSVVLAKERLREWLAAGELPWSCMSWNGLDAERIARLDREQRGWIVGHIFPSVAYHEGDPQFWRANLNIDWEENEAWEKATGGARAQGIKVSRERLLALLPEEPLNERVEKPEPEQTRPAEPESLKPKAWLAEVRKDHPRQENEPLATYAGRLHALMQGAHETKHVTKLWTVETLLRRLHDK